MKKILVLVLLTVSVCLGANEIQIRETTGQTDLYCIVVQNSDMKVWDGDSFETLPTWTDCDIALTEHTLIKGLYYATMPTSTAGKYSVHCYKGASPAATDTFLQGYNIDWSGTEEKTFANVDAGYWLGTAVATPTVAGVPEVDMTHINGLATNGNNATLSLKRLDIQNDSGSAFYAFSSSASAVDFYTTAANSAGLSARAATGNFARGIDAYSTAPNGYGIYSHATDAAGRGFRVSGGLADIDADLIIGTFEGNLTGSIGSLGTQAKLDVNTEADTAITDAALAKTSELASVKLAADGLDNIANSEPAVWPPQNLKDTINAIYRWYFNKKTATTTEIRLYGDDGETVIMTKPVNYDGVTKTVGKPE